MPWTCRAWNPGPRPWPSLRSAACVRRTGDASTRGLRRAVADLRLAARLQAGDQSALADAYDSYAGLVLGLARRRVLGDDAMAEEVTQEVFIFLWEHPDRFDPARGTMRSWLGVIAHRRSVDRVRAEARRARNEARVAAPEPVTRAQAEVDDELVADLAGRLRARRARPAPARSSGTPSSSPTSAAAPIRQVAVELAIPEGTAKSRLRLGARQARRSPPAARSPIRKPGMDLTRSELLEIGLDVVDGGPGRRARPAWAPASSTPPAPGPARPRHPGVGARRRRAVPARRVHHRPPPSWPGCSTASPPTSGRGPRRSPAAPRCATSSCTSSASSATCSASSAGGPRSTPPGPRTTSRCCARRPSDLDGAADAQVARTWWLEVMELIGAFAELGPDHPVAYHHLAGSTRGTVVVRTFELWTHDDDIRRALGLPPNELDHARLALMSSTPDRRAAGVGMALAGTDAAGPTARRIELTGVGRRHLVRRRAGGGRAARGPRRDHRDRRPSTCAASPRTGCPSTTSRSSSPAIARWSSRLLVGATAFALD